MSQQTAAATVNDGNMQGTQLGAAKTSFILELVTSPKLPLLGRKLRKTGGRLKEVCYQLLSLHADQAAKMNYSYPLK